MFLSLVIPILQDLTNLKILDRNQSTVILKMIIFYDFMQPFPKDEEEFKKKSKTHLKRLIYSTAILGHIVKKMAKK